MILERIELMGAAAADQLTLVEFLDQYSAADRAALASQSAEVASQANLAVIYLEAWLRIAGQLPQSAAKIGVLWKTFVDETGALPRERLVAEYQRRLAPLLPEFAVIERNYLGSRLYVNPLTNRAPSMRVAYLAAVVSLIALRFNVLAMAMTEDIRPDETTYHRAAGLVDGLMIHDEEVHRRLMEALGESLHTSMRNLCLPALF